LNIQTGVTILKILQKRVPYAPTALTLSDGEVLPVHSLSGIGRDFGDDFDHFQINWDERDAAPWRLLFTDDIRQITDPETGAVVFDALDESSEIR
jgi:hypothetical protein